MSGLVQRVVHRPRRLLVGVAVLLPLVLAASGAEAAACKKVSGSFTLTPLSGPACTSPVGICATGVYKGGIKASSVFTGTSLIQTVDTPTTAVVLLTGDNLLTGGGGTLQTKDAIVLRTTGAGDFAEVDTIGGTGPWAGASGGAARPGHVQHHRGRHRRLPRRGLHSLTRSSMAICAR
jgi:hypothetical protein